MTESTLNYTIICKIAEKCLETNNENSFEYKSLAWTPLGAFKKTEILEVMDFCNIYKRIGFEVISEYDYLCVIHKNQSRKTQEQYFAQKRLLPMIIRDYMPEADLSVAVGTQNLDEKQPLKVIKKFATAKLYEALFISHKRNESPLVEQENLVLPENFLPTLCQYQERTVRWLLKRERCCSILKNFFKKLEAKDGVTSIYKNTLCTLFTSSVPKDVELAPGGILADEMGLGKTVEMLALILLHKHNRNEFRLPEILCPTSNSDDEEVPLKKLKTQMEKQIVCICRSKKKKIIECSVCHVWQHQNCVNKFNVNHEVDVNEPYICPYCWRNLTDTCPLESSATLIVTPNIIKNQWINEIGRHISPKLRLHIYKGISHGDWISPRQLADYDVVLTDYSILRREVFYTSEYESDRAMRHKAKRSMRIYTPLLMIKWWRVCLDEAQMVESDTSQMAALVRSLPAVNRWAVTGTPIQRSIDDLYPLVRFIGLEDTFNDAAWETLVKHFMLNSDDNNMDKLSSLLLVEILQNFMWRTCKEQVLDELPIPPQTEVTHRLDLSNLERLFYTEQHEECELKFNETLNKYIESTVSLLSTSHQIMKIIMKPLLKIRQCCIIPVITSNSRQSASGLWQKQFLQPKELHAHMKLTNEMECKSQLRSMASSYNGCAAIHFLKGNYQEAVKNYEAVLKLAHEYSSEKNISVDSLLQIHALYNIMEARNISSKVARELPEKKLRNYERQLNTLEWKYLETYASQLREVETAFQSISLTLQSSMDDLNESLLDFLSIILDIQDSNLQTQLMAKILDECIRKFGSMRLDAATSLRGVLFMIVSWFDSLMSKHNKILAALNELNFYTSNVKPRTQVKAKIWREMSSFINSVYECHLMELRNLNNKSDDEEEINTSRTISRKRKGKNQNICKLCKLLDLLNSYECLLFKKSIDELTNVVEGDENPQLEIQIIKIIFAFLKPRRPEFAADMEKHLQVLHNMQNFCKKAIKYWIEIEFSVKGYDELDMCKMRISLTDDEEGKSIYKLSSYELDSAYAEQQQNLFEAQRTFALKLARLKYIRYLETNADNSSCPICKSEVEIRHIVLECGHELCLACYRRLRQYSPGQRLTCSICRNVQNTHRVYFLTCFPNKESNKEQMNVSGEFSSKITYIVQLILKLQRDHINNSNSNALEALEDSPLKILIFSQWQNILNALAIAFDQNNITYIIYSTIRTIENYKNPAMNITCLLMPLSSGCKGLNLIEATHVFLVEPILNPSEEQQAIGRVHRFGQTKPTTVHRFIVNGTIEENIYKVVAAGKESQKNWEFNNLTFESLKELFKLRNNVTADINDSINESTLGM